MVNAGISRKRRKRKDAAQGKVTPSEYSPRGIEETVKISGHPNPFDLKQSRM
jgi:hypothetical protein